MSPPVPAPAPKAAWVPRFPGDSMGWQLGSPGAPPSGAVARIEKIGDRCWRALFSTGGGWDYTSELDALKGIQRWHETGRIG